MTLNDSDMEILAEKLAEKLSVYPRPACVCDLSDTAAAEMRHFTDMLRDVGNGDMSLGVETLRSMLKRYMSIEALSSRISSGIVYFILISLVSGVLFLIRAGVVHLLKK